MSSRQILSSRSSSRSQGRPKPRLLKLQPPSILKIDKAGEPIKLMITNNMGKRVAFKIKTNQHNDYIVTPNGGFLEARKSTRVLIILQQAYKPYGAHKFKVIAAYDDYAHEDDVDKFWHDLEKDSLAKKTIQSQILTAELPWLPMSTAAAQSITPTDPHNPLVITLPTPAAPPAPPQEDKKKWKELENAVKGIAEQNEEMKQNLSELIQKEPNVPPPPPPPQPSPPAQPPVYFISAPPVTDLPSTPPPPSPTEPAPSFTQAMKMGLRAVKEQTNDIQKKLQNKHDSSTDNAALNAQEEFNRIVVIAIIVFLIIALILK